MVSPVLPSKGPTSKECAKYGTLPELARHPRTGAFAHLLRILPLPGSALAKPALESGVLTRILSTFPGPIPNSWD